jgi:integrase
MRGKTKATKYPGVKLLANRSYRVRGDWIDERTGLKKEVDKVVEADSARAAAAIRADLIEKQKSAVAVPVGRSRVSDFAKSWLRLKGASVSSYTLRGYAYALDDHLLPELGDYYYDALTPADVQKCINTLLEKRTDAEKRYALDSVRDWFRVFRNMTHDAIAQLGLLRDPTLRVTFPQIHRDEEGTKKVDDSTLTTEEANLFLEAMRRRPGSYALAATLGYTGLRFCHASALKIGDADFDANVLHVRRSQVRGIVGPISRKKRAPEQVPMSANLAEILCAHVRRLEKLEYATDADAWLFPSRKGTLRTPASLVKAFRVSEKDAELGKRVTPHGLRYFFNDELRRAGVDEVTHMALTGHVTKKMRQHYSTVGVDEKRAAVDAVAKRLADAKLGTQPGTRAENTKAA